MPRFLWRAAGRHFDLRRMMPHVSDCILISLYLCAGACVPSGKSPSAAHGDLLSPPAEWSSGRWNADNSRLGDDLPRAIEAVHWAVIRMALRPAALEVPEESLDDQGRATAMVWRADALMPDGREARIVAWTPDPQQVAVAVRVGSFGDAAEEQRFVDALREVLDGPPKRKRRDKFVLPRVDAADGADE